MTKKNPRKDFKLINLEKPGRYCFTTPDGVVTVYGQAGIELTRERILWLLQLATAQYVKEQLDAYNE